MTKGELRKLARSAPCKEAPRAIEERLKALPEYRGASNVFIYASVSGEPDTYGIITSALEDGKNVALPLCEGNGIMRAVRITSPDGLVKDRYGIPSPPKDSPVMEHIAIAVIPCVCAGRHGERLGHGAGYYDRFLANTDAARVCLCFESNISGNIPMEKHDLYMDCVITEKGVYRR